MAFFHFTTQPTGNHMVAGFIPPRLRGLGYGIYFFVSFGAGAFGATFGGWASERVGLERALAALAVFLLPAIVAGIVLSLSRISRPAVDRPG